MAPVLHCVRHAQGFHNLGLEFSSLPDPRLTPLGVEQCEKLRETHFADQSKISYIFSSPLRRTVHTAHATFQPALDNGKCYSKIVALPDAQETSDYPCDTGSDLDVLIELAEEENFRLDTSMLHKGWHIKTINGRYSPADGAIKARARDARKSIRQKMRELVQAGDEDAQLVLVTHGGYLHYFTNDWEEADKYAGTGWKNCETRTYTFQKNFMSDEDTEARLIETKESRATRGKDHPMIDHNQQEELYEQTMQYWEGQGLQTGRTIENGSSTAVEASLGGKGEPTTIKAMA